MTTASPIRTSASARARAPRTPAAPVWNGPEYAFYPPGIYDVRCNKIQGPEWVKAYQRWALRLECNFLTEEGTVSGFLNLGNNRNRPQSGRHSNYFKVWCKANVGLPKRGQVMEPSIFVGKFFRVRIETATKNSKGECLSEGERYSKIVEFLDCVGP